MRPYLKDRDLFGGYNHAGSVKMDSLKNVWDFCAYTKNHRTEKRARNPKTNVVVAVRGVVVVTVRNTRVPRVVVPTTTPNHPIGGSLSHRLSKKIISNITTNLASQKPCFAIPEYRHVKSKPIEIEGIECVFFAFLSRIFHCVHR